MSVDCEQSPRNLQDLNRQFGSSSGSTELHRGSVPQIVLLAAPTMQSSQRRGRELLNERRKPQRSSLATSQIQRKRSSSLGAEVSLTVDHSYVPVQREEDGSSVSTSPKQSQKLSTESCSEVAAAESLEKKVDLEEGSPLADKEGEQESDTSPDDGMMEKDQLLQELAKCRKQIQVVTECSRMPLEYLT